jgi:hypothetical protein
MSHVFTLRLKQAKLQQMQLLGHKIGKARRKPREARIRHEWDFWAKLHPEAASLSGSLRFVEYLKNRRPDLLVDFRASGDKALILGLRGK